MPSLVQLLRRLADEYEAEESQESSQAAERARDERIERLEQLIQQSSSGAKSDALDELSDDERQLILRHRAGSSSAADAEGDGDDQAATDDDEDDSEEERLPRQRLNRLDVPRIWSGEDEPETVRYRDDEGKIRTRKGRRRGEPYGFDIADMPDEDEAA